MAVVVGADRAERGLVRVDGNSYRERHGQPQRAPHRPDLAGHREPAPDRALGIVLLGLRVAEVQHDPVADVLRDVAVVHSGKLAEQASNRVLHLAHVFGIQLLEERRGVDEVAEEERQRPAFALGVDGAAGQ